MTWGDLTSHKFCYGVRGCQRIGEHESRHDNEGDETAHDRTEGKLVPIPQSSPSLFYLWFQVKYRNTDIPIELSRWDQVCHACPLIVRSLDGLQAFLTYSRIFFSSAQNPKQNQFEPRQNKREEEEEACSLFNSDVAPRTTSSMGSRASRIAWT